MGLFSFFRSNRGVYRVSLHKVAHKLNTTSEDIVLILKAAGFRILNMPTTILNEDHLEILSNHYVDSIRSYYNTVSKKRYTLSQDELNWNKIFFSRLVKKRTRFFFEVGVNLEQDVFDSNLDDILIKDLFFELIDQILERERLFESLYSLTSSNFNYSESTFSILKYKIKLKLRLKQAYRDIRSRLYSILVCNYYHIISDDEVDTVEAMKKSSFSGFIYTAREALKFNNLKFQEQWKMSTPL